MSQRRRAPASTWPAVSRGTSPSPCCSPTTTSSAEGTARKHCFPRPSSSHSTAAGAPRGEPTDSALGPFIQQPGPALKLRNVKPTEFGEDPAARAWAVTASQGLGLSPPPTVLNAMASCSLCQLGEPPAYSPHLVPTSRNPLPDSPLSDWKWTGFVPTKCPNAEKTRLLGPW